MTFVNLFIVLISHLYRHQSDVLHMYQILTKFSNIPKEKVILFLYDDLANCSLNPQKGIIINEPNGTNLYEGLDLSRDYTRSEVTVDNFLKVLKGDQQLAASGKKVLKSGFDENVLIYYSDHGNPGFLNFPDTILSASKLNDVLQKLSAMAKFNQMVIALESCYSGSIFDQNLLKPNLGIYAITATNARERSFSQFLQNDTYLSDVFSQNWFYSWIACEKENLTLAEQYEIVRRQTNQSHVSEFGDFGMANTTKLNEFLHPTADTAGKCLTKRQLDRLGDEVRLLSPSSDVELTKYVILEEKKGKLEGRHSLLHEFLRVRHFLRRHVFGLAQRLARLLRLRTYSTLLDGDQAVIEDRECYERLVETYHANCFRLNEHTFLARYLQIFYIACNKLKNDSERPRKMSELEAGIVEECVSLDRNQAKMNDEIVLE